MCRAIEGTAASLAAALVCAVGLAVTAAGAQVPQVDQVGDVRCEGCDAEVLDWPVLNLMQHYALRADRAGRFVVQDATRPVGTAVGDEGGDPFEGPSVSSKKAKTSTTAVVGTPEQYRSTRRNHDIRSWLRAGVALAVYLGFLRWSFGILRSSKVADNVRREFSVALYSSLVYLAMAVPLMMPREKHGMPPAFYDAYCWLPFWYIFLVTTHVGTYLEAALSSLKGGSIAVFYLFLLNSCMPGGAGALSKDAEFSRHGWFPGGYSLLGTVVFTSLMVYSILASSLNKTTKQFALGFIGQWIVEFMDPSQTAQSFNGVIFDWRTNKIAWDGPVLCQCYILGLAVVLAGLSLPILPCLGRSRHFYSCLVEAEQGLASLARDTCGSLDQLVTCFREGTTSCTLHSSYLYIRQLGARRSSVDKLLECATYECITTGSRERLDHAREVSRLLRGFRQVLRMQLDLLRGCEKALVKPDTRDISLMLDDVCIALRDSIVPIVELGAVTDHGRGLVASAASGADLALLSALKVLEADDPGSRVTELVFVEGLRTCPMLLQSYLAAMSASTSPQEHEQEQPVANESRMRSFTAVVAESLDQHLTKSGDARLNAMRNLISWLIALGWCLHVRDHASTCVVAVSFLYSSALGSLFDRNTNRMIGVGMGLVISNLPAVLLTSGLTHLQYAFQSSFPQDFLIYLVAMSLMWTASVYGYLASGAKWSYACNLWAGFGGVQMLTNLQRLQPLWRQELPDSSRTPPSYPISDAMMDNFTACFVCLLVDLFFARLFHGLTSERVASVLPQCLTDLAEIVKDFRQHPTECDLEPLQRHIALARVWDGEVRKEDLVWSMMWVAPYKGDLVQAVLECCDDAYVAACAIQAAAVRVGDNSAAAAALAGALPEALPERMRLHGQAVGKALCGELETNDSMLASSSVQHPFWELSDQALCWARVRGLMVDTQPSVHMSSAVLATASQAADAHLLTSTQVAFEAHRREAEALAASPAVALPPRDRSDIAASGEAGYERRSATTTLKTQAMALCLAQRRLEALIREHAFWASEEWQTMDALKKLRSMSEDEVPNQYSPMVGSPGFSPSPGESTPMTPRSECT